MMMSWLELTGPAPGSDDKARLYLAYLGPCPEASCGDNTLIDRPFCSVLFSSVLFVGSFFLSVTILQR